MNWGRSFVAVVCAFALVSGSHSLARAQATTTDSLTVTLAGGVLSFTVDVTTELPLIRYSHADGYTAATGGALNVTVKDDRNSSAGYIIDLSASDFFRDGGTGTIDLGVGDTRLAVGAATSVTKTAGPGSTPVASGVTNLTDITRPILTAGSGIGNGHFTATGYSLSLTGVPATTPPGTYISTLTVSSTAGPQS